MVYALLICRSLTYAQRTAGVLERSGLSAYIQRTPKQLAVTGCSYSVKISPGRLREAAALLEEERMVPLSAVVVRADGDYEEVGL